MFLAAARPMKVEWNIRPYFGVFERVFRALSNADEELSNFHSKSTIKIQKPIYYTIY